jgi:putative serine protease PepD
MKRPVPSLAGFSLLGVAALAAGRPAAADLPEVVDRAAGSVLLVEVTPADARPPALDRTGPGFVIDPNGHVVTASALVSGARAVRVRTEDGRRVDARVIGADETFGLAVLGVEGRPSSFPLGRADLARLGEPVSSVTRTPDGRLSARAGVLSSRGGTGSAVIDDDLTVDFPLDDTFVGAPLLDAAGRVLGMFTVRPQPAPPAGPTRRGRAVAITIVRGRVDTVLAAVPIDVVSEAVRQILERGRVDWPWVGVTLRMTGGRVEVATVAPGAAAGTAGVAGGDVVTTVDGRRVRTVADVQRAILIRRVGQRVSFVVERAGQSRTFDLVLEARPRP